MTAEARADYTALLWERQEVEREAASVKADLASDDYLYRLAAMIPHPFLGGDRCGTCDQPSWAAIHHWDDAKTARAA